MPLAKHPKAALFVRQNLFADVTSFAEFEARVAALPDEHSRGHAFEVFAEAYLATQRKHDAAKVWPLSSAPIHVIQTLGLAGQDYGVDGVFQTILGNFNAYQVKFRTNRPALNWRELSTFMGLADSRHIRSRVLFTNCDDLPSVLNERQGFFCIRGADLDRLQADDLRAIEAWLADCAFTAPKKQPLPHQIEALDVLLPALEVHDRVSPIMACGTGKTLVALWIAERRQASLILVLVPSLALLRQTLHEWLRETCLPCLAYLCVCSDPSVKDGVDAIATTQSDLDFQVTTDAASVRDFLDATFSGVKIIFSTYQSAQVVGAALQPGEAFDLGVFDEAHKTAGREGRNHAFALEDANLPIRKRLFLTATPRHYNPLRKDKEGEAQLVFSMDNPEVYGPQAYRLSFAEAARRGIICGYKVIISVISSEMVTNELLSRGEVLVKGDAVHARQVANQIALRDAIVKYGARKVFTFHRTVKSAASFCAVGGEGVRSHLPDFGAFHVNGTMPTARREREMRYFRDADRAVMSNARCLTEGVDVPAVDMVAFLSPRRSRVDIVQATGRAMRLSPETGKTTGYVLVPLYVELAAGESVEDAVSRAQFDEVWDVLHSLQEQDDVLADLIRDMGEQKGSGKGFDDALLEGRVEITGIRVGLEAIRSAVTTRCFERLFTSWNTFFGKLTAFKERYGHCNATTNGEDVSLGAWVSAQRSRRNKGVLPDEQVSRLNDLGFVWDWQSQKEEETWAKRFQKLKQFKDQSGHCNASIYGDDQFLGRWVSTQRTQRSKGLLSQERIKLMDELGFVWDYQSQKGDATWMKWYRELETYVHEHGNPHVPKTAKNRLSSWVSQQRQRRKGTLKTKGKVDFITAEQIKLLDKLGFHWEAHNEKWEDMLEELKRFKERYGHVDVYLMAEEDDKLVNWEKTQRDLQARGELDVVRKTSLDEIGFLWNHGTTSRMWIRKYELLKAYQAEYGNADVPYKWTSDPTLSHWVSTQRGRRKNGLMSDVEVCLLDSLGFTWKSRDVGTWEDRLAEVAAFQAKNGHSEIPLNYPENPKLGHFVNSMRTQRNSGKLSEDRIVRLDALGFVWKSSRKAELKGEGITAEWKIRFEELLRYKEENGNCKVPKEWSENPQLGRWVSWQRQIQKSGKLHPKREDLLNSIGFSWWRETPLLTSKALSVSG